MPWAPAPPHDERLPEARDLLSPGPPVALIQRFLAPRGWSVEEVRPVQAVYWPGRSCTVRYRVRGRPGGGNTRYVEVCAEARRRPRPFAAPSPDVRFPVAEPVELLDRVLIWAVPYDPELPGLADASRGGTVRAALDMAMPTAVSVERLRYRARSRAVLRYRLAGGTSATLYGKVLQEEAVERTLWAYRHVANAGARPAKPEVVEGIPGLVVFPELPGRSLRDRLLSGDRLPSPQRVARLQRRIGEIRWRGPERPRRPAAAVRSVGRLLGHLLPERGEEIRAAAEDLGALAEADSRPVAVIHGDLYDAQVFVGDRFSLGLIDLEDAGPGDPLLEAGNFLAHLSALHAVRPAARGRPLAYRTLLRREVLEAWGATDGALRWREALCSLLLATTPFRALSPDWPRRVSDRVDVALRMAAPRRAAA